MSHWINLGQMLRLNAKKYPERMCLSDRSRRFTFAETNRRVNRLANALTAMGLGKGDRISALLENCIEFVELYLAAAKTGVVVNPVNFRCVGPEISYIANDSEARAFVVHDELVPEVQRVRGELGGIPADRYICVGDAAEGYREYEALLEGASEDEPGIEVLPSDTWIQLYTSGTTGKPKGVIRSHESYVAFYLINAVDFGFSPDDVVLNVMPLCHVNTTFFTFTFTYIGAGAYIHPARGFDARVIFEIIERERITFISLIPTHYALILAVPDAERARRDLSSIRKLLCSSAPARVEQKKGIMRCFPGVELYEGYGSTEAGIVTVSYPDEQLSKPGSIGRENVGTDLVKILDEHKEPVPRGAIGELYSRGPMMFDGYWKQPEKTAEAFAGEWFSAGDMAYEDEDGYYFLVDRKNNMIITGGENVYPSEVEKVIARHPAVFDVAVIGVAHPKWGEAIEAVIVPREGAEATEAEIVAHCRGQLAAYKCPKTVRFIAPEAMPRTATGKILHRVLREQHAASHKG